MMSNNSKNIIALIVISVVFFVLGNGILSLTNPDEVFYAQTAKEMIGNHTWVVPYLFGQPQFEKPIFTFWLLRVGIMLFGVSNFNARFFPAIFAILGAVAVYILSLYGYKNEKKAFICAFILMSSGLYIGLARTLFTDMVFSVFILLSLGSFFLGYIKEDKKTAGLIWFFIFSALAVLTKGPLGFCIPFLIVILFLAIRGELRFLFCRHFIWGLLIFLGIALPWYLFMIKKFGTSFIHEFFYNVHIRRIFEAEHRANDSWYFYPASMVGCMFPWSLYVMASFLYLIKKLKEKGQSAIYLFLSCWILVTFVIFQIAHSKLVSYIFPLFPALAIITGDFIYNAIVLRSRISYILSYILWFLFSLFPVGLVIASKIYPQFFPSTGTVSMFILFYLLLLAVMLFFILSRRLLSYVYLSSFVIPLFLFFAMFSHSSFDAYVSSKRACEYLLNRYAINNTIICSKFFVRGVRYYADKEVAVIDINGDGFFSPHPVPYFNSDKKVKDFLLTQPTTYCIVNKSSWFDIQRIANSSKFKLDLLKIVGDEYIVRIQPV